jgi:hypothetical protein
MATANPISDIPAPPHAPLPAFLFCSPPCRRSKLESVLANLTSSFPAEGLMVATPDALAADSWPALRIIPVPRLHASWTLTAADFINAYQLAGENQARAILMLGPGSSSLSPTALRDLANAVLLASTDLAIPCYDLPPYAGLINSAILYPLTRALFVPASGFLWPSISAFPCAWPNGSPCRAALHRRSTRATRCFGPSTKPPSPASRASEVDVGPRATPQPAETDINAILASVTGSLFADIDAKAAFWQRPRLSCRLRVVPSHFAASTDAAPDIAPHARRISPGLHQPAGDLVAGAAAQHAARAQAAFRHRGRAFRMPDGLWARIVFDFLLAYRLRTINRGHLLGALIPLYLAWVASHINITASGTNPERHIEAVAAAFEADKPYLVSRWRWPDRFNP